MEKSISFFSDILDAVKKNTQFYRIMVVAATAGAVGLPNASGVLFGTYPDCVLIKKMVLNE
jgi:hypothetical protein